tara:strand:- start:362 stop:550 length:189 start_codon:yes stop_codon:yes gene_type:complete
VARYTVELSDEDVGCIPKIKGDLSHSDDWQLEIVFEILQQIEEQAFDNLIKRMNEQRGMTKE